MVWETRLLSCQSVGQDIPGEVVNRPLSHEQLEEFVNQLQHETEEMSNISQNGREGTYVAGEVGVVLLQKRNHAAKKATCHSWFQMQRRDHHTFPE